MYWLKLFLSIPQYCRSLGRHTHIDKCRSPDAASCNNEGTRHIPIRINPNPDEHKDYVSHSLFWKRTGFKGEACTNNIFFCIDRGLTEYVMATALQIHILKKTRNYLVNATHIVPEKSIGKVLQRTLAQTSRQTPRP